MPASGADALVGRFAYDKSFAYCCGFYPSPLPTSNSQLPFIIHHSALASSSLIPHHSSLITYPKKRRRPWEWRRLCGGKGGLVGRGIPSLSAVCRRPLFLLRIPPRCRRFRPAVRRCPVVPDQPVLLVLPEQRDHGHRRDHQRNQYRLVDRSGHLFLPWLHTAAAGRTRQTQTVTPPRCS